MLITIATSLSWLGLLAAAGLAVFGGHAWLEVRRRKPSGDPSREAAMFTGYALLFAGYSGAVVLLLAFDNLGK